MVKAWPISLGATFMRYLLIYMLIFYRTTHMHGVDYAVATCLSVHPSVCLSHACIVSK